jgi:hypothetical protein
MQKIVSESLIDFRNKIKLNEGVFDTIGKGIRNIGSSIKGLFQKVGKFFFPIINGEVFMRGNTPVNVGIMVKDHMINTKVINYMANQADISLEPSLASLNESNILKRFIDDEQKDNLVIQNEVKEIINELKKGLNKGKAYNEALVVRLSKKLNETVLPLEHPDPNSRIKNVNRKTLINLIRTSMNSPEEVAVMIWGAPGIGKTQIVNACLKSKPGGKGRLIDLQTSKMRNDDWAMPYMKLPEPKEGEQVNLSQAKGADAAKDWIPGYIPTGDPEIDKKLDELHNGENGGVIFLDELSRAYPEVQNTCLKLINERIVGNIKLASKWAIIAASNREGDDPILSGDWSPVLGDRFIQCNYVPTFDEWKEWAYNNKIDTRIMTFLEFNPQYFYYWDTEAQVNATPRAWHRTSVFLQEYEKMFKSYGERMSSSDVMEGMTICIGTKIGDEFVKFLKILETFSTKDIEKVLKDPDKARVPDKKSLSEATGFLAAVVNETRDRTLTPTEFTNYCKYLVRLDNSSIAGAGLQMLVKNHPYLNEGMGDVKMVDKKTGETTVNDKFKEGIDIFVAKYKDFY